MNALLKSAPFRRPWLSPLQWMLDSDGTLHAELRCWKALPVKEDVAAIVRVLIESAGALPAIRYLWLTPLVEEVPHADKTVTYKLTIQPQLRGGAAHVVPDRVSDHGARESESHAKPVAASPRAATDYFGLALTLAKDAAAIGRWSREEGK